jgi:hypothetical protein
MQNIPWAVAGYPDNVINSKTVSKEDEVGGTCGTHGGGERCLQGFGWKARR